MSHIRLNVQKWWGAPFGGWPWARAPWPPPLKPALLETISILPRTSFYPVHIIRISVAKLLCEKQQCAANVCSWHVYQIIVIVADKCSQCVVVLQACSNSFLLHVMDLLYEVSTKHATLYSVTGNIRRGKQMIYLQMRNIS